jgi:AAA family ATP:ADP antiporter
LSNVAIEEAPRLAKPLPFAAWIGVAAAFQLCGYEFIRSTSNTLFKEAYGAVNLPVVMAASLPTLLAALYVYGRVLTWLGPRRTLLATSAASALAMLLCYAAITGGSAPARRALYIIREVYVVLLIEQYWSLINSTLTDASARKFNGPICGLGSLGAILGAIGVGQWSAEFGTPAMILLAAASVVPAAYCSDVACRLAGEPKPAPDAEGRTSFGDALGLKELFANRLLLGLFLIIVATQVVSAVFDLAFQGALQEALPNRDQQNAWSGNFYAMLNGASAFGQFVLAPLVLAWVPLRAVHLVIPAVHCLTGILVWRAPTMACTAGAYLLFKALDYSVFRAAKELLYLPLNFDARYRAKELIDVFGYRFGKGASSFTLAGLSNGGLTLGAATFGLCGAGAAGVWLLLVAVVMRRREEQEEDPHA